MGIKENSASWVASGNWLLQFLNFYAFLVTRQKEIILDKFTVKYLAYSLQFA